MQVVGFWQVFLAGAGGGCMIEMLRWWKLKESPQLPEYAKSKFYWFITLTMIIAGGFLAVLHGSAIPVNAFTAVNIGASAPALLGALAAQPASINQGKPNSRRRGDQLRAEPDASSVAAATTQPIWNFLSFR
ncbi:hypothetical protein [Acidisoma sp. S159]|uniref:hypothetical protein n=1 Tax=Acidisoma sp. S159 TaxID=1747225 RepID=UPI00131A7FF5|nr:hypothetical protein [Acidisoma sp. S159]